MSDMSKLWTARIYQEQDPREPQGVMRDRFEKLDLIATGERATAIWLRATRIGNTSLRTPYHNDAVKIGIESDMPLWCGT